MLWPIIQSNDNPASFAKTDTPTLDYDSPQVSLALAVANAAEVPTPMRPVFVDFFRILLPYNETFSLSPNAAQSRVLGTHRIMPMTQQGGEKMTTQAKEKQGKINGVDVDQLFATIEVIKGTPDVAKFQFRVRNEWVNAGHNHIVIKDFHGAKQDHRHEVVFEMEADEPEVLLGDDKGPNPVEYLLAGLSGCLTSSLIYHAAAKGIRINGLESRVEGDLDLRGFLGLSPDVKVGFESIRVYFKIDADVSGEQKEELILMAQKYSPVFNTITNITPVSVSVEK